MKKTLTFFSVLVLSVGALAQTDTIAGRVHALEGVTITESRRQHVVTSTSPLHLLDRNDFTTMGVIDMADALHRMPGITLRDYGGAGGMKTVSVRGFGAKHTGVSYDGVMLSECQSGEIDLSRYSLDNVEALSLVVGDNDDIFVPARQATTPATLHIQTVRLSVPDFRPHLTAQMKTGSFGYASPFVRYDQSVTDRFGFSVAGEFTYSENDYPYTIQNGIETINDRRTNNRMNAGHGELNFFWSPDAGNRLIGKVYYYDNDRQLPGMVHYYVNVSGETLRDRNAFGQLLWQSRLSDKLSMKCNAKFNWASSEYCDRLYPDINDASYWQREGYASAALLYIPCEQWAFDYSADYAYNNLNGSSSRTVVGRPYRHTILQTVTAKYRHRRLTVLGRMLYSLYLNGAKEGNSARNMSRLSPSVSLSYQLIDDAGLYVRASYKNIFRSPTFNESYYYHYGSTDLKPESTDQLNVGLTYGSSPSTLHHTSSTFDITLDGYYNRVKDMIVAVPKNMFVWSCVNVGRVEVLGADAMVRCTHRLADDHRLTAMASYSYQCARNITDAASPYYKNQIAYMPEHTVSASLGYENPWVNATVHGIGVSSRWANNEHYADTLVDGYADFGITLWRTFRWGCHQLEGRFDLKNVFDAQYEIVLHYPMPGRSFQFAVNYKF